MELKAFSIVTPSFWPTSVGGRDRFNLQRSRALRCYYYPSPIRKVLSRWVDVESTVYKQLAYADFLLLTVVISNGPLSHHQV